MLRLLLANLVALLTLPVRLALCWLRRPRAPYVELRIESGVVELAPIRPFFARFIPGPRPKVAVSDIRRLVRAIVADPARTGLLLTVDQLSAGAATLESLLEALAPLRPAGRTLVVHLRRGGGAAEALLAASADRAFVLPPASLLMGGFGRSSLYFGKLLERLGVRFERFARAEFKTAFETLERDAMSAGQRTQAEALYAGLAAYHDEVFAARGRPGLRAQLEAEGWVDAQAAVRLGLVEAACYEDELAARLGLDAKKPIAVSAPRYLAHRRFRVFVRPRPRAVVGLVELRGMIADDGPGSVEPVVSALRALAREPRVAAVVVHVDSPGGSAFGSERLHHEALALRRHKPLVVSFGDVAASGGYFVAAAAESIVARGLTVTGSIGVVAARPDGAGLVARLGVVREVVGAPTHDTLFDPTSALGDASRAAFDRAIDASYRRFVEAVAEGRGRSFEAVEPLARGRVYLARDAAPLGLVDGLGGLPEALDRARALARARTPALGAAALPARRVDPRTLGRVPPTPPAKAALARLGLAPYLDGRPAWYCPDAAAFGVFEGLESAASALLSSPSGVFSMLVRSLLCLALALPAVGCGGTTVASTLDVRPMPDGATYHGVWFSQEYGEMHLCQSNDSVVGEYTVHERQGTIRGTLRGDLLQFEWREERNFVPGRPNVQEGHGYFRIARPSHTAIVDGVEREISEDHGWMLRGRWGIGDNDHEGGPWTAVFQERQSPDRCYNSVRRTSPTRGGDDEIRFNDEGQAAPPTPAP